MSNSDDSLPPGKSNLFRAFEALASILNERGVRYAIIGGMAMAQHSRARATDVVDAIVAVPQIAMPGLFEALRERGFELDMMRNVQQLRQGLTTLRFEGVLVDLLSPVIPVYAHALDRAQDAVLLGQKVRVASAEGLITTKLIAMRPQDEADIRDILTAYGGGLDLDFIRAEMATFTEPEDPRRASFEAWVREARDRADG